MAENCLLVESLEMESVSYLRSEAYDHISQGDISSLDLAENVF